MNTSIQTLSQAPLPPLETFENPLTSAPGVIRIIFPEFTCLCPKTGYPDFASIHLYYQPDALCVELKSWKLYLNSFRQVGTFHEAVVEHLFSTICKTLAPRWAMVAGDFFPRGNVDTSVVLETQTPRPPSADVLIQLPGPHCRQFSNNGSQ